MAHDTPPAIIIISAENRDKGGSWVGSTCETHEVVPHHGGAVYLRRSSSPPQNIPRRKTTEHSGNSPRSANKDSSSSRIGKNIVMSVSPTLLSSANTVLSSIVDDVDSMSANQLNSSVVINDSSPKSANFPSNSRSGSSETVGFSGGEGGGGGVIAAAGEEVAWWLFLEAGQVWLCSQE